MSVKHASDIAEQPVKGATKATIQVLISPQEGPNFAMRRFVIKRGGSMPKHTNTLEHEQFVLHGRAVIGINMEVCTVQAGDVVLIPEGALHWYVNNGDEDFEFLCIVPNKKDDLRIVEEKGAC